MSDYQAAKDIQALRERLDDTELRMRALLDHLEVELSYEPQNYTAVKPSKEDQAVPSVAE